MNENNTQPSGAERSAQPTPLDVSVKITPSKEDGNLLAFANVTLGGCFAVTGIRVMNSDKGVFVAMPDRKNAKGEYVFPPRRRCGRCCTPPSWASIRR